MAQAQDTVDFDQELRRLQSSFPGVSRQRLLRHFVTMTIKESLELRQHRAACLLDRIISSSRHGAILDPDTPLSQLTQLELGTIHANESKYTDAVSKEILEAIRKHPEITLRSLNVFEIEDESGNIILHSSGSAPRLTPDSLRHLSRQEVAESATRRAGIVPSADCVQAPFGFAAAAASSSAAPFGFAAAASSSAAPFGFAAAAASSGAFGAGVSSKDEQEKKAKLALFKDVLEEMIAAKKYPKTEEGLYVVGHYLMTKTELCKQFANTYITEIKEVMHLRQCQQESAQRISTNKAAMVQGKKELKQLQLEQDRLVVSRAALVAKAQADIAAQAAAAHASWRAAMDSRKQ